MTLRSEAPSATPDPYIDTLAASAGHLARQVLAWRLDALRYHAGMVRVPVEGEQPDRMFHCLAACAPYAHFHEIVDVVCEWCGEGDETESGPVLVLTGGPAHAGCRDSQQEWQASRR